LHIAVNGLKIPVVGVEVKVNAPDGAMLPPLDVTVPVQVLAAPTWTGFTQDTASESAVVKISDSKGKVWLYNLPEVPVPQA